LEKGRHLGDEPDVLPFNSDHGIPTVGIELGSRVLAAHIDTMAPGLSVPLSLLTSVALQTSPKVIGKARTVSGEFDVTGAVISDDIHIGRYAFHQPFIEFNPRFQVATLGLSALRNFAIRIDGGNSRVQFISDQETFTIPAPLINAAPIANIDGTPVPKN
jgi:hypothetical protein